MAELLTIICISLKSATLLENRNVVTSFSNFGRTCPENDSSVSLGEAVGIGEGGGRVGVGPWGKGLEWGWG